MKALLVAVLLLVLAPVVSGQNWDYDDQPDEDRASSFGEEGGSEGSSGNFLITTIVCGAIAILASFVLPAISPRRTLAIGRRLQVLLLLCATILLVFGNLLSFIDGGGIASLGAWGIWEGSPFFPGEDRITYFGSEFDLLAEGVPSLQWLKVMGPALALAALFAGLSAVPRDPSGSAVLASLAVILAFVPLLLVGIGLDKLGLASGAEFGTGGVLIIVAWFLLAAAPLMRFVRPISSGPPAATPVGHSAPAPYAYPAMTAPDSRYEPAPQVNAPGSGGFIEVPNPVAVRLICPGCRAPLTALRGQPVRCGTCGRAGRAPG